MLLFVCLRGCIFCRHTTPTKITVVKSVIRPEGCGDTVFADTHAAYDALDADVKNLLTNLNGKYSYLKLRQISSTGDSDNLDANEVKEAFKYSVHPLITTHPITGLKNIFANPSHTVSVLGWSEEESTKLLEKLFAHTAKDEFSYRHKYEDGDVLVWDNRGMISLYCDGISESKTVII